ncbi:hypothetical protein GOBAR_AA25569 [Gossypium barbadense]|uniref:Pentatricopeptide repeat-containing protein n=1 Tax=Gossypium barbadense TaxID=3634 RepID=A0A2P5WVH0_GOSBA|nr:hypothetical protein GOBAR_AA25569 [Gossypium barbadense]
MEVCGYTLFAQSFKAFSVEIIHLALNIGIDVKMITSNELVIGKKTGHRLGGSYEQKYDIVMRLQQITHICGLAGDDVSDTPVLKKASIGIATDVACGASDIVLLTEPMILQVLLSILRGCLKGIPLPERDSTSVNSFVSSLAQNGELDEAAMILIKCGNRDGWSEDLILSCNTLIDGYGQKGKVDDVRRLFNQIPFNNVQADGRNRVFERNVVTWNSMIIYIQILDIEEALNLFNMMAKQDNMSWNSMIFGYTHMGYEKNENYEGAIKFFIWMLGEGENPDKYTLFSILSVCTGLVDMQLGMQIHQLVSKTIIPNVPIQNSLITMYLRYGALVKSRTIFDELKSLKDVIS